jgi:3-methyladenine DNA glycosylase AlkD
MRLVNPRRSSSPVAPIATIVGDRPSLVVALRAALRDAADPEAAPAMQAYMKSAMPFWGIAAPRRRALTTDAVKRHPLRSSDELHAAMAALWRDATHREERYAAIDLPMIGRAHRALVSLALRPLIEAMIVEGAWWDHVDAISGGVLAELVRQEPAAMKPVLLRWATGRDLWLRRAAMLCQRKFKGSDFDAELFYQTILPSVGPAGLHQHEFFIRKGIGWALRERAYAAPDEVRAFCHGYKAQLAPLTVREALRVINQPQPTRTPR